MEWTLPGLFESNARNAVNGSLWTLTVEVRCYLLLAILGFFGLLKDRVIANFCILALLMFGIYFFTEIPFVGARESWARPSMYFLIGVFFYVNRDKVILDLKLAVLALIIALSSFGKDWFLYVFPLAFVYLIFFTAYATKFINTDKVLGDVSYGLYIYAWPVQQMVAQLFPDFTPVRNMLLSTLIVVSIAFLSWHWLEKPMLMLKSRLLGSRRWDFLPGFTRIFTANKAE
jgi:peptidoglycan/LPS O-acetylase OafA/YrhL